MEGNESYFTNMIEYEVLKTNGDKRLVKRIRHRYRKKTKREIIDY